jgi:hypothetical protein
MELGSHMVPILNNIGTDVACVGVSHLLFPSTPQFIFLCYSCTDIHLRASRTMTSTSASNNSDT